MKNLITSAALLLLFLIPVQPLQAQQLKTIPMFETQGGIAAADLPDHQNFRTYFRLNSALSSEENLAVGDRLQVPLGGQTTEFQIERISEYTPGTYSVIARGDDERGELMSYTIKEGRIIGDIHLHERGELYQLAYDEAGQSNYLASVDSGKLDVVPCPAGELPSGLEPSNVQEARDRKQAPPVAQDEHSIIDVLVVYTNNANIWMEDHSSTDLFIAEAMNRSQMAMDASEIMIELNLAHAERINYPENSTGSPETLERLTDPNDGHMDEVHTLRDNWNADLVAMFAEVNDVGGIAWILLNHNGQKNLGFSVNRVQQLHTTYTLVHEMGHNMGNHHSRNQSSSAAPAGGGLNEYSTGWRWIGNDGNGYASVMTYNEGDQETPYFSNPNVSHQGVPTGSYSGTHAPADNARSMNEVRGAVEDYEERIQRPAPPTLQGPTEDDIQVGVSPTFTWNASDRADSYDIQVSTRDDFASTSIRLSSSSNQPMLATSQTLDYATVYYWRVRAKNAGGASDWSASRGFTTVVDETKLEMNYPNPFRGNTTIKYQLAEQTDVLMEVYDPIGRKVTTLVDENQPPRIYHYNFDGTRFASGIYIVRLVTENVSQILKMTLVK